MSKKQIEALAELPVMVDTVTPALQNNAYEARETAVNFALAHHKINGGMLTVAQLVDNAKQFHAYITGEQA